MKRRRISSASSSSIWWSGRGDSGSPHVSSKIRSLNQSYEKGDEDGYANAREDRIGTVRAPGKVFRRHDSSKNTEDTIVPHTRCSQEHNGATCRERIRSSKIPRGLRCTRC